MANLPGLSLKLIDYVYSGAALGEVNRNECAVQYPVTMVPNIILGIGLTNSLLQKLRKGSKSLFFDLTHVKTLLILKINEEFFNISSLCVILYVDHIRVHIY